MNPSNNKQRCLRLIREVLGNLGWRYKVYVPMVIGISMVFLLPPRFLQFFTAGTDTLSQVNGESFVKTLVLFGVAVALCLWLAIFLTGLLREWLRLTVSMGLRRDAVNALHRTRIETLDTAHRGDWMTRVTSDLRNCEGFLTDSIPHQIQCLTLAIGSAVLFFLHSGWVALIPCGAAVVLAWINARVQQRMSPVLLEARELEGDVFQSLMENYEGLRTIRSSGGEAQSYARIDGHLKKLYAAGMRIIRTMASLMGLNDLAAQLVVTLCLSVVAYAVSAGELTAESVLVYPFFIMVFLDSAKHLAAATYDWNRFFIEGGRLASVLYDHESGRRNEDFGELRNCVRMSVSGLEIGFGDRSAVISGLDFEVRSGEIVAVLGASGCGKSTLLECLAGLREPRAGSFSFGPSSETFESAPTVISAFVEQRPYLFVGTMRENLLLGSEASDDAIWEALKSVDLEGVVKVRGGLDTVLTDRGLNMSEGQRYRLTLCRALLSGRSFLLLDEPFAALDEESIRIVVKAITEQRARGAGVVIVTHLLPKELVADRRVTL
jgi:ABC-type multidrug transport system fused ATPase/permease subunit